MARGRRSWFLTAAFAAALAALVALRLWGGPSGGGESTGAGDPDRDGPASSTAVSSRAAEGFRFTDVTAAAGLDVTHSDLPLEGEQAMTSGVAVNDVDRDGDLDLYLTRVGRAGSLMLNDGSGHFTDGTDVAGVPGPSGGASAAAFADVEGDGDPDLFLTAAGADPNVLYLNDGTGRFSDGTVGSGLDDLGPVPDPQAHGATFADPDRDGDLDLVLTHWDRVVVSGLSDSAAGDLKPDERNSTVCPRSELLRRLGFPRPQGSPPNRGRFYRNDGSGRFRDASAELGIDWSQILGFTATFADVDRDGWDDLLVTGDFCTSRLFRNENGTRFTDVTEAAAVGTDENGMGSVARDVDGDGDVDWFVTSIGPAEEPAPGAEDRPPVLPGGFGTSGNRLYLNRGDGTFSDATDRFGVRNGGWGWGAAVEDLANDGRLSFVMTNGYSLEDTGLESAEDPMKLWVPAPGAATAEEQGEGVSAREDLVEIAASVGLVDTGIGHGLVPFDMDRDGDLDIVIARFGGPPVLYRNDSEAGSWLTVRLEDPTVPGNRSAVGARVVVDPEGDAAPVTTWVRADGSYESQLPAEIHAGLGEAESARVEVTWPGAGSAQVLEPVAANQVLTITRPPSG